MANWVFQTGWLFVIGCWAPDHKRNDCELMFACFSVLRTKIQTIPLIERYGHWHAPGFTALFSTIWGTLPLSFTAYGGKTQATRFAGGR
jgi:hypothetical protein